MQVIVLPTGHTHAKFCPWPHRAVPTDHAQWIHSRPTKGRWIQGWAMKDFSVLNVTHEISKYKLELKLKINTRSLFNRTLNPAHPPLRCCALLALRSIQVMTGLPCLLRRWGDTWGCWSPGGGGQGFAGLGFRFPACLSRLEEINHSMLGTHLSFSLAFLPGLSCPLILFSFVFLLL